MPSLRDVAALAGVSIATVSNVVNNSKHVTAETRERVERAIKRTGYVPNQAARALASRRKGARRGRGPQLIDDRRGQCGRSGRKLPDEPRRTGLVGVNFRPMSRFKIMTIKSLALFTLLFAALPASAGGGKVLDVTKAALAGDSAPTVDVWPEGKMPGRGAGEPEGDGPSKGDGVRRVANVSRPSLTMFPAPKTGTPAPAVVIAPGGGYSYVVFDKEGTEVAAWLNSVGVTSLVLKYRVPHNRESPLQGVQRSEPRTVAPPDRDNFHVYLLMGQSNMVGRDTRTLASQVDSPRVLTLDGRGRWVLAREPMHVGGTGVGPGIPFALEMLKADPKITIGLVPCAVGGTPLRRWVKGADLYERAVSRAKTAAPAGVIKGVLWHQGESDTTELGNAETYETRLTQMFKDLRDDFNQPDLPIVVGQLGDFLTPEKYPYVEKVRRAIEHITAVVPGVGYADSRGLGHKGDDLHFSADAEQELGARFAVAMRELQRRRVSRRRL